MSEVSGQLSDWGQVRASVAQLVANSPDTFETNPVNNVHDLLAECVKGTPVPTSVAKGYWETVSFSWGDFEIEVFDDRLEIYRFYDQRSEIWYEEHQPGDAFSPRLVAELATLVPQGMD
jgi:hypothetical protein